MTAPGYRLVPEEPTWEMCEAAPAIPSIHAVDDLPLAKAGWSPKAVQNLKRYRAMIAAAPQPEPPSDLVERLAQWLHDEVEYPDPNFPYHNWPEHPDDTGQRGDGWLKIVPKDTQEQFRDIAKRLATLSQKHATAEKARADKAEKALASVHSELGDPDEWKMKLAELHSWTGSAFLAGEKVDDEEQHKRDLYSFTCGLIGYLMAAQAAAICARKGGGDAIST